MPSMNINEKTNGIDPTSKVPKGTQEPGQEIAPTAKETKVTLAPDTNAIRETLDRRYESRQIIELRALGGIKDGKTQIYSGLYTDHAKLTADAGHLSENPEVTAIYTGLQKICND